jgi:hypothetical protein
LQITTNPPGRHGPLGLNDNVQVGAAACRHITEHRLARRGLPSQLGYLQNFPNNNLNVTPSPWGNTHWFVALIIFFNADPMIVE